MSHADVPLRLEASSRRGRRNRLIRRLILHPGAFLGGLVLLTLVLAAIFAPQLAPYDWRATGVGPRLAPPSAQHLLGTDLHGRDVFSRLVHGGRYSLTVGITTVLFSMVVGSLFGITIAYFGGRIDHYGSMAIDVMLGFPPIVLAILIVAVLGVGLTNVVIAVGIAGIPRFARVVRSAVLVVKAKPFVEATRALGAPHARMIFRHMLPNVVPTIIVLTTLNLAGAIISTASLSFLGLGAQPPVPEWGAMLNTSREYMRHAPWTMVFPGLALFASVMAVNLVGDRLSELLDPRVSAGK
ncbi:MAG: ABC transporter permease [bacterium]|nr:ABC transporter permease [bacterium]